MLLESVLAAYPQFGKVVKEELVKQDKFGLVSELEEEYAERRYECDEFGSSDMSNEIFEFARDLIYALRLREQFEATVINHKYQIIKK